MILYFIVFLAIEFHLVLLYGFYLFIHSLCLFPPYVIDVVQLLCHVPLCNPWPVAHQASLSFTIFQSLLTLMFIVPMMPSNCLILCCPLLLLPSIFPSIRVFSNELACSSIFMFYFQSLNTNIAVTLCFTVLVC